VDRRRFLLVAQTFMLLAALAPGALALAGLVTPVVLLALVFALGAGQAWTSGSRPASRAKAGRRPGLPITHSDMVLPRQAAKAAVSWKPESSLRPA
jgi:Transmembrane secretion effector